MPQGWSGTVTPSLSGYSFTPTSRNYSSVAANQPAQDYAATVVAAATTTTLTSSGNPATVGTAVTFTATVTGSESRPAASASPRTTPLLTGAGRRARRHRQQPDRHLQHQQPRRRHPQHRRQLCRRCRPMRASSSAPLAQVINPAGSAAASFVGTDLATQGNWKGRYGSDGYAVLSDSTSYPAYAEVTPTGKADYVWAAQPDTDPRALQRGVAAGRIAACWYSGSSFNVDVNLTDQASHRVTLYLLDWDTTSRVTRIDVLDAGNPAGARHADRAVVPRRRVSGVGPARPRHPSASPALGGSNAVLSGIFFDAATCTITQCAGCNAHQSPFRVQCRTSASLLATVAPVCHSVQCHARVAFLCRLFDRSGNCSERLHDREGSAIRLRDATGLTHRAGIMLSPGDASIVGIGIEASQLRFSHHARRSPSTHIVHE